MSAKEVSVFGRTLVYSGVLHAYTVALAFTFSVSDWSTERQLFETLELLTSKGIFYVVIVSVDNKDFLGPGSITANSSHFFTVVVSPA